MPLSSIAFETLHDLIELRINSFIVTNPKEAVQLANLHRCREELLQAQNTQLPVQHLTAKPALRPSRRLQREINQARSASA